MAKTGPARASLPAYFNCIDAVRVLAALAVVIFHYHHFYMADELARADVPAKATFPYAALFSPFFAYGYKAVELFWVISGFVFAHVYLHANVGLGRFALARFARLYPLHIVTLFAVLALQWISLEYADHWQIYGNNTPRYFLFQLVMGSHWTNYSQGLSFNGPIWSVSLEIGAYFMFFFALVALRAGRLWVSVGLTALCWLVPVWPGTALPVIQLGVFNCAGYFFWGVSFFIIFQRYAAYPVLLLGIAAALAVTGFLNPVAGANRWTDIAFSGALILAAGCLDLRLGEAGARLRSMGNISYSLYLVHVPFQMVVLLTADLFFGATRAFAAHPLTLPAYLLGSVLLSVLAFRYIERPAGSYLRGLSKK